MQNRPCKLPKSAVVYNAALGFSGSSDIFDGALSAEKCQRLDLRGPIGVPGFRHGCDGDSRAHCTCNESG